MDENPSPAPGPIPIRHPLARLLDRLWPTLLARRGLLPAIALVPLLLAGCEHEAGGAPATTKAAKLSRPAGKASPTRKPHKPRSGKVVGKGWVEDGGTITSYQLEISTGPRTSRVVNVSEAVYDACDFRDRYPGCAEEAS